MVIRVSFHIDYVISLPFRRSENHLRWQSGHLKENNNCDNAGPNHPWKSFSRSSRVPITSLWYGWAAKDSSCTASDKRNRGSFSLPSRSEMITVRSDSISSAVNLAVDHPVGFHFQGKIDLIGWHGFIIGCPVQVGHSIHHPPIPRNGMVDHIGWELRSAFELNVFYKMRNAGDARFFIARTQPGTRSIG